LNHCSSIIVAIVSVFGFMYNRFEFACTPLPLSGGRLYFWREIKRERELGSRRQRVGARLIWCRCCVYSKFNIIININFFFLVNFRIRSWRCGDGSTRSATAAAFPDCRTGGLTGGSRGGGQCCDSHHDGGDQGGAAVLLQTGCTASVCDRSFYGDRQNIQTLVSYYRSSN